MELIVAIAIFGMLILAAAVLYVVIIRQQIDDRLVQSLQRERDRVTAHFERHVIDATAVADDSTCNVQNDGAITLDSPDGTSTYRLTEGRIEFTEDGTTEDILEPGVTASGVRFFPTCDGTGLVSLKVEATLAKSAVGQSETTDVSTTFGTRPQ